MESIVIGQNSYYSFVYVGLLLHKHKDLDVVARCLFMLNLIEIFIK